MSRLYVQLQAVISMLLLADGRQYQLFLLEITCTGISTLPRDYFSQCEVIKYFYAIMSIFYI